MKQFILFLLLSTLLISYEKLENIRVGVQEYNRYEKSYLARINYLFSGSVGIDLARQKLANKMVLSLSQVSNVSKMSIYKSMEPLVISKPKALVLMERLLPRSTL